MRYLQDINIAADAYYSGDGVGAGITGFIHGNGYASDETGYGCGESNGEDGRYDGNCVETPEYLWYDERMISHNVLSNAATRQLNTAGGGA